MMHLVSMHSTLILVLLVIGLITLAAGFFLAIRVVGSRIVAADHPPVPNSRRR